MTYKESRIYVFWICRDKVEAKKIIHELLEAHLIACACEPYWFRTTKKRAIPWNGSLKKEEKKLEIELSPYIQPLDIKVSSVEQRTRHSAADKEFSKHILPKKHLKIVRCP